MDGNLISEANKMALEGVPVKPLHSSILRIAKAIREVRNIPFVQTSALAQETVQAVAFRIADAIAKGNDGFDDASFLRACEVYGE